MDTHDAPQMADLVFAVRGTQLPEDYRYALLLALREALPWLDATPRAGVLGIRSVPTEQGVALLAQRARLTLRLPLDCIGAAAELEGTTLHVAGLPVEIGAGHVRALPVADTLHADFVATGSRDETDFVRELEAELARLDTPCRLICGRPRRLRVGGGELVGHAVALHGLTAARALRLQEEGLGTGRLLGCGIFVQHKSIAGTL